MVQRRNFDCTMSKSLIVQSILKKHPMLSLHIAIHVRTEFIQILADPLSCSFLVVSDPTLALLPPRDNIKRRIRLLRQTNQVVKEPNDPNFASVPDALTKTLRDDLFLRCDTGPGMMIAKSFCNTPDRFLRRLGPNSDIRER